MKFIIEQSNEDLTPHSGLALVGALLRKTDLVKRFDKLKTLIALAPQISHGGIIKSYLGLLCQGKNDFDCIEEFRQDNFFALALGLKDVPSSPTLRQRMNGIARHPQSNKIILEESARLICESQVPLTPIQLGSGETVRRYLPLDVDVSPFDNSKTKKEGVSRTYKGHDGYAPIFAYLGEEGYCINVELREGSQHCQNNTTPFLKETILSAKNITTLPLLVRLDSGNDSADNIKLFLSEETEANFIIKRNLRRESDERWLEIAKQNGTGDVAREGKTIYLGSIYRTPKECDEPVRIVYQVVERTILKNGQILLTPQIEVETYWTSLPDEEKVIIELYHQHGTSEQFHSEIKSDLDLERLPSGKFATNDLILHLGVFAYNILRIIGQLTLQIDTKKVPLRKKAQRRRIKTVIQNLITLASRLVYHARRFKLRFGRHSPWLPVFNHLYISLT